MLKLKRTTLIVIVLCIILGVGGKYLIQQSISPTQQAAESSKFKPAPDFELMDTQGKKHRLRDFAGSLILLHFWASWCPPCLDEIPQWVELNTSFKDKRLQLIAVSLDQTWEDAQKILPSQKLTPHIISLLDPSTSVADSYGSYQFPETYLISPDLKIMTKWVGPQDWNSAEFRALIQKLLADF